MYWGIQHVATGRLMPQKVSTNHHHAGRAKAALQAMTAGKSLLHWMQALSTQAFYGDDLGPLGLRRQHRARFDGTTVKVHRAATTLTGVTAHMGAGQT